MLERSFGHFWKAYVSDSSRRPPKLQIMLVASPRNQLNRHEEVARFQRPFRFLVAANIGQISPSARSATGHPAVLASALRLPAASPTRVAHLLLVNLLAAESPVRDCGTAQNPNDSCIAAAQQFCDSRWFWDSFGTVRLVVVRTCVKILGNSSRGVAQPGSAPALGEDDPLLSFPSRSTIS
jgi:hypothetical protein